MDAGDLKPDYSMCGDYGPAQEGWVRMGFQIIPWSGVSFIVWLRKYFREVGGLPSGKFPDKAYAVVRPMQQSMAIFLVKTLEDKQIICDVVNITDPSEIKRFVFMIKGVHI